MIFISSTCSKQTSIKDAVVELVAHGFKSIELSGGTRYYAQYFEDLCELKEKHNLNYRLHNYFPPPEKSFVLNLASHNEQVVKDSREMVKRAIEQTKTFGSKCYGMHAGFRISPKVEELGQKIQNSRLLPFQESLEKFKIEYESLANYGKTNGVELLLENNVFSAANFQSFNGDNPFFLTNSREYFEMCKQMSFPLLLDIAHLKVSCRSLNLNFVEELETLLQHSNYIHISENDGLSDSNHEFTNNSDFAPVLKKASLKSKTFTIEVYDGMQSLQRCHEVLEAWIG